MQVCKNVVPPKCEARIVQYKLVKNCGVSTSASQVMILNLEPKTGSKWVVHDSFIKSGLIRVAKRTIYKYLI